MDLPTILHLAAIGLAFVAMGCALMAGHHNRKIRRLIEESRMDRRDRDEHRGSGSVVVDDPDPVLRAVVEECWRTGETVEWREGDPLPGSKASAEEVR